MKPSEVLRKARELIAKPENWCKGSFAKTADGKGVLEYHDGAVAFCSAGAVRRIEPRDHTTAAAYLSDAVGKDYVSYNDHNKHADVLAMFEKGIALAEAEGQ